MEQSRVLKPADVTGHVDYRLAVGVEHQDSRLSLVIRKQQVDGASAHRLDQTKHAAGEFRINRQVPVQTLYRKDSVLNLLKLLLQLQRLPIGSFSLDILDPVLLLKVIPLHDPVHSRNHTGHDQTCRQKRRRRGQVP